MTHVVLDACVKCKFTDCAAACPIDNCFVEGPNMLVIDPLTCIDCGVCVAECPVDAIFPDYEDQPNMDWWIKKNAELAAKWGPETNGINDRKDPLPDADEWNQPSVDKRHLIEE